MAKKKEQAVEIKTESNIDKELSKEKIYEDLIIRKEQCIKDSLSYETSYMQEFGELISEVFKAKIECIRLKKTVGFCQAKLNRGMKIDVDNMNSQIEEEMAGYYAELKRMIRTTKEAKETRKADDYSYSVAKRIYRRICKVLHPDINSKTETIPRLKDLWNQVMAAYYKYDADTLEDLEVLVNKTLKELGDAGFQIDMDRIDEKIERLEKQISRIVTTKPYIYGEILEDEISRDKRKHELEKELEEYKIYATNLEEILAQLLLEGGATLSWRMN